jgi:hypothetical protein
MNVSREKFGILTMGEKISCHKQRSDIDIKVEYDHSFLSDTDYNPPNHHNPSKIILETFNLGQFHKSHAGSINKEENYCAKFK